MKSETIIEEKFSKGRRTEVRIIESATDLFMTEGLYNVTFAQIAKKAGLTQPGIYRHFSDMDDLILRSCLYWVTQAQVYIDAGEDEFSKASLQLSRYIERNFIYTHKHRAQDGLLLGLYYYSMRSAKMLTAYQDIKTGGMARIERYLLRGNRDGSWSVRKTPQAARIVHSFMVGEILKMIVEPAEMPIKARIQQTQKNILKLLK